jgi:hypothetical protein
MLTTYRTMTPFRFRAIVKLLMIASAGFVVSGCSSTKSPEWAPDRERRTFGYAISQLPPEPVYGRLRWVHPPEVLPSREVQVSQQVLLPAMRFEVKNQSLEESARILAQSMRYTSYTASSVATNKVTLRQIGTLDELAHALASRSNSRVFVDHENRQLRFVDTSRSASSGEPEPTVTDPGGTVTERAPLTPRFYSE